MSFPSLSGVDGNHLLFKHPANLFISGPSSSGKTQFVKKLIEFKDELFNIIPEKIIWCYKEWQHAYTALQESHGHMIKFIQGIPEDENEIVSDVTIPHVVVFDDMLGETDEEKVKLWFTRKGHHRNASVIYITQNLFQQTKSSRTISLNSHYMILFQSPRDKSQIKVLAHQLQAPHLNAAYTDATLKPHGYLLVDLKPDTPESLRLRTDIFHHWRTRDNVRGPVIYTTNTI